MKNILITGSSSGFGLETARHFSTLGWRVIATMRTPNKAQFTGWDNVQVVPLDVTDLKSIRSAIASCGPIDVLVNNAGIGYLNPLEATPMDVVRDLFETNTLGTIAVMQAVLPQFRERKAGVVVNVTSSVTLLPLPLLSIYTASKAAINAFSDSVALELEQFNVRVHVVVPGQSPETPFSAAAQQRRDPSDSDAYAALTAKVFAGWKQAAAVTHPSDVAQAIWSAATDPSSPRRILAGADAVALGTS